jgi:hypothetical protein
MMPMSDTARSTILWNVTGISTFKNEMPDTKFDLQKHEVWNQDTWHNQ